MKKQFILFVLIYLSLKLISQDISGDWQGIMYQPNNRMKYYTYGFSTHINQQNSKISGTNRIWFLSDASIYGVIEFTGEFNNNKLKFTESEIIKQDKKGGTFVWCIKTGTLNYSVVDDTAILSGDWVAISPKTCVPGKITLKRAIPKQVVAKKDTVVTPVKLDNRRIKKGTTIKIPDKIIRITVFDSAQDDGDTISLTFNDVVVLSAYRLTKIPYTFEVTYDASLKNNTLVLYAHNVGRIPPNTAKIIIESGDFTRELVLQSDMKKSDVIYFKLK